MNLTNIVNFQDLDLLDEVRNKTRLVSCMVLIRNNIVQGNIDIGPIIKSSKHDKSKTFDKILASMIEHCDKNINENDVNYVCCYLNINTTLTSSYNYIKLYKIIQIVNLKRKIVF